MPDENVLTGGFNEGGVNVLYGSSSGLTTAGSQWLRQGVGSLPGTPEDFDYFGSALAMWSAPERNFLPLVVR